MMVEILAAVVLLFLGYLLGYYLNRDDAEVLFFPDQKLPCNSFYSRLEGHRSRCGNTRCHYAHQEEGLTSLMRLCNCLNRASGKIDLCIYNFTEAKLADLLIRLFNSGVEVRVITDPHSDKDHPRDHDKVGFLQMAGIPVKSPRANTRGALMHNKFVIIDDKHLLMGSFNWTRNAITKNNEAIIKTKSRKIVKKFHTKFQQLWRELPEMQTIR